MSRYINYLSFEYTNQINYQKTNNIFLQSSYNPEGIITSTTSDLFKKLIVIPECNNINKIIKSEITIIPKSNLSKTLIILICTIKMDLQNYITQFICLQEC